MIDRSVFTGCGNPETPVPLSPTCTVPTERMANLLADLAQTNGKVLEVGTGSGYQTAILAGRCREVVSIEIEPRPEVSEKLPSNVILIRGDGCALDTGADYDAVIVSFAARFIAWPWGKQVREGGRLVVPIQIGLSCRICVYEKHDGRLQLAEVAAYAKFAERVA